ncbi:MAG: apolipoprotein N-acyltransferase [Arenicellales bacterium]
MRSSGIRLTPDSETIPINSLPAQLLAAVVAGCIGVFGFGPFDYFWAALVSAAAVTWLWWDAAPRRAAWLGFAYGAGLFGAGVSWVYVSMHVYGHMSPWMAILAVMVFVAILSLYPALVGWIYRGILARHRVAGTVVGLPALWALGEWVRSWAFTGFPWLSLGYSQVDSWLRGWSPVLGIYGVSWLTMLTAVLLVWIGKYRDRRRWYAASAAAIMWLAGLVLGQVMWTNPVGKPVKVALVQGNVSLEEKWAADRRPAIMKRYLVLSNHLEDRDLIVWPEAALPYFIDEVDDRVWRSMRQHPADFILGVLERESDGHELHVFNSVVAITHGAPQVYRKAHLVPFGEYLPLRPLFGWVIDYLHIPMSDFSAWPGPDQGPLKAGGTLVGVTICYEDAFPEDLMKSLPAAEILANVSEDAWFGLSLAPGQRIQMARMRAIETQRPMLRAANTGVSAIIDDEGTITARSRQFVEAVVKGSVQPRKGSTPFIFWGNRGIVSLAGLLLLLAVVVNIRSRETQPR